MTERNAFFLPIITVVAQADSTLDSTVSLWDSLVPTQSKKKRHRNKNIQSQCCIRRSQGKNNLQNKNNNLPLSWRLGSKGYTPTH